MTTVEKFDKVLVFLEKRAKAIGYNIDADSRYTAICSLVTELDMGLVNESEAGNQLIMHRLQNLMECFCPKDYEIFTILFEKI